jgi:hypothetical protein
VSRTLWSHCFLNCFLCQGATRVVVLFLISLQEYMAQEKYKADEQGRIDYQTYVRIMCSRRVDHSMGK